MIAKVIPVSIRQAPPIPFLKLIDFKREESRRRLLSPDWSMPKEVELDKFRSLNPQRNCVVFKPFSLNQFLSLFSIFF